MSTPPAEGFEPKPVLKGKLVELHPMEASHLDPLFAVASDPKIWEQHPKWDRYKREVFEKFFNECLGFGSALVIRDAKTKELIGSSTYKVDAAQNQVEIGWTYLARAYWGGRYNGEVKRLMLAHAFGFFPRVVFRIGPNNLRSRRAVEKIGAVFSGEERSADGTTHVVYKIDAADFQKAHGSTSAPRVGCRIALIGEYTPSFASHAATGAALEHAQAVLQVKVDATWVSTEELTINTIDQFDGFWIAPGSPYKNLQKTLALIRSARERMKPCFGTCGGFQHMVIEHARNVLGFQDAQHAEYDPYASKLFISRLKCSLVGKEMPLNFSPNSMVAKLYGATSAVERYYCNFGINPEHMATLERGAYRVVGRDDDGAIRVMELTNHPFFVGTLFVPQTRSIPEAPHPLVVGFVRAAASS